jgi:hypothetical protein
MSALRAPASSFEPGATAGDHPSLAQPSPTVIAVAVAARTYPRA